MKAAHTVVEIPEHWYRVPAYQRKHLRESKVRIGLLYQPKIQIQPSVETTKESYVGPAVVAVIVVVFIIAGLLSRFPSVHG